MVLDCSLYSHAEFDGDDKWRAFDKVLVCGLKGLGLEVSLQQFFFFSFLLFR